MTNGQLTIPVWGLYMMLAASAIGTYLLARQLSAQGWPKLLCHSRRGVSIITATAEGTHSARYALSTGVSRGGGNNDNMG